LSPAWLEEGLASQVAVATPASDGFEFSWSWRDDTLSENFGLRPRLSEFFGASWTSFSADGYFDMPRAAALQAMAAVCSRYLDAKGKLSDVYFAIREQHFSSDLSHYKSYSEIVEETLGRKVEQIDADFAAWFQQQKQSHARPGRTSETNRESSTPTVPCEVPNMAVQQRFDCKPQILNQRAPDLPGEAR